MYFLYYAGMGADRQTEQIGLATSEDGVRFRRAGDGGLIVARNLTIPWKNTRVCNPAVVVRGREMMMFYQGAQCDASGRTARHTIGVATSGDGVTWTDSDEPVLRAEDVPDDRGELSATQAAGVIEPCLLVEDGQFRMWFIHYRDSMQQGALCHAVSQDGRRWNVTERHVLVASQFGNCRLHYPHVIKRPGFYEVWFSLRSVDTGAFGIFKMRSEDGLRTDSLEQILPHSSGDLALGPRELIGVRLGGRRLRGMGALNWAFSQVFEGGRRAWGYAHPHLVEENGTATLYYQRYNLRRRTHWMDIGCGQFDAGQVRRGQAVLSPSPDPSAWDSFFVADPFVLNT